VAKGFEMVNRGCAKNLIISPASQQTMQFYRQNYSKKDKIRFYLEEKARSTFENAYYSSRIIRQNRFKSVVLVTHDFHLARSYFLLKTMLIGADVKIHCFKIPIEKEPYTVKIFYDLEKQLFNEMLQFWGSYFEGFSVAIKGHPPYKSHKDYEWIKFLKSMILF
jgi:hypothetical protein